METASGTSPIPLHVQIRNILLAQIQDGRLEPGAQIHRERELGERFGVSLAPVRQRAQRIRQDQVLTRAASIIEVTPCDPASRVIYRADRFRFALERHRSTGRVVHVMG